jgi:hypothetical protein
VIKGFRIYPIGPVGAALLLLRGALAGVLAMICLLTDHNWLAFWALILAVALLVGYQGRIVAVCAAIMLLAMGFAIEGVLGACVGLHGLIAVACFVLGPGGYSIDARLFGRRVVRVQP